MGAGSRLERYARRLAAGPSLAGGTPREGAVERVAVRLAASPLTRRQAIGAAAAGSLALAAGLPQPARAQQAQCPPPGEPGRSKVCNFTCPGLAPSWICCFPNEDCCTQQPQTNGIGACAVGCCAPGQNCCYVPSLGAWGCCGCPIGLHHCGKEPIGQCCQRDEVCDTVDFVCRPGDECPNVVCEGACCEPGEVCAGGNCCQASKGCPTCCGRGEICAQGSCKQLVDFKRPPRQRQKKNDKIDSPKLETFDADLAAELNYRRSTPGGSAAGASAAGFLIARKRVRLRRRTRTQVSLTLTRRARRHLRRGRPLPARLTMTFREPGGRAIVETAQVTILPKRRR
jgi:hypothetical protein